MALEARFIEKRRLFEVAQVEGPGLETPREMQEGASCGPMTLLTETGGQLGYLGA